MTETMQRCRLYLLVPPRPSAGLEAELRAALTGADIACVLVRSDASGGSDGDWTAAVQDICRPAEVATLIEDDAESAAALALDGMHVTGVDAYEAARDRLGSGVIVGAGAGTSRHDAMVLAERAADYVALGGGTPEATEAMTEWWAALFEIPCVAWNAADADAALRLAERGADFVALSEAIWTSPNAAQTIVALDRDLARLKSAA